MAPDRPVMLGIVGDSAAGKTTITAGIAALLGTDRVTVVRADDYHRYNRRQRRSLDITALHPGCNHIDILEQHLHALSEGQPVLKPVYDHATGDFAAPEYVEPTRFVIVEGLLPFHTEPMRSAFHLKVALDPPDPLRRRWKVARDCAARGYTAREVLRELDKRELDSETFIRPQMRWADLVVQFHPQADGAEDERLDVRLTVRPTVPRLVLGALLPGAAGGGAATRVGLGREDDGVAAYLEIEGLVSGEQASLIQAALWAHRPELRHLLPAQVGRYREGMDERRSHPLAVAQLFIAYYLLLGRPEYRRRPVEEPRGRVNAAAS